MNNIPQQAEEFTTEWMNEMLSQHDGYANAKAISVEATESAIPGQTAEIILLRVNYDSDDPALPERMVAKVTSRNPVVLEQVIASYDQYRRETSFYREFTDPGISVPECLFEYHDPDTQQMLLLMRDLAPSTSPSWAATPDQVEQALSALPGLHGKWWNQPALREKNWMVQFDNAPFFGAAFGAAHQAGSVLTQMYDSAELTREAMALMAGKVDKVVGFFGTRNFTFVHGDYHAKQMFFPTVEGGGFAVIDWQFPFVAAGPWDFARMLSMCMNTQERQSREVNLQQQYLTRLAATGVENYSQAEFEVDYRMGLAISQMIMAIASADTDPEIFRLECEALGLDWKDVVFNRTQKAMEEWDVLSLLRSL